MPDRDLEKTIQQLKDALPKIEEKIANFSRIINRMRESFEITAAPKGKDLLKNFAEKFAEKKEQEEFLQMIAELIIKIDKKFKGKKITREMQTIRKAYELHLKSTQANIRKLNKYMAEISKKKLPAPMQEFSKSLWNSLENAYLDTSLVDTSLGWSLAMVGPMYVFLHWMKIEGPTAKITEKVYIILSQEASPSTKVFTNMKCSIFKDRIPSPPYKETDKETWFIKNSPPVQHEVNNAKADNDEKTKSRLIALLDLMGFEAWIATKPGGKKTKNKFTPTAKTRAAFKELSKRWLLKMHPATGKGPVVNFLVRREWIEEWDDTGKNLIPDTRSDAKIKKIASHIPSLMPKARKLDFKILNIVKTSDPTKHDPYAFKMTVKFFEPGILTHK